MNFAEWRLRRSASAQLRCWSPLPAAYFIRNAFIYQGTDDAQVDGHIMPLSARINGQVLKVNFVKGQLVHECDVLVIIYPEDFKIAMIRAQATLEDAKASATSSHWNVPGDEAHRGLLS